jgi:hypothetical protein
MRINTKKPARLGCIVPSGSWPKAVSALHGFVRRYAACGFSIQPACAILIYQIQVMVPQVTTVISTTLLPPSEQSLLYIYLNIYMFISGIHELLIET